MSRFFRVTGLLLLLPVGGVIVFVVSFTLAHRYDDTCFGSFHSSVHGKFSGIDDFFFVSFEGRTKPRWHWIRPENYCYEFLDVEWIGEGSEGAGRLLLPCLVLEHADSSEVLTEAALVGLLLNGNDGDVSPTTRSAIKQIYSLFAAAGEGELPPPRHHLYHFEEPAFGTLVHFSLGYRFPYAICAWGVVWSILFLVCLIRKGRKVKLNGEHDAPLDGDSAGAPSAPQS